MLKNKMLSAMGGAPANYIEDVFSTYLYTGNGSTQTITNGIDLAGEGGLVWIKSRSAAYDHFLMDTARGVQSELSTNNTGFANTATPGYDLTAFNSNGFSLGPPDKIGINTSGPTQVSWTFRKQPKFFDVVTYTGTGSVQNIAHSLGSTPGCIMVKCISAISDWAVYHRSISNTQALQLNTTGAVRTNNGYWNSTSATSTQFTVGTGGDINGIGKTYIAYIFAHDAGGFGESGTDNVISCGSYTGTGAAGNFVSLGYEPQWLLIKRTNTTGNWLVLDNMRGITTGGADAGLFPNLSNAEDSANDYLSVNATGFELTGVSTTVNASGSTYIYIAIRRGPMKTPTTGTEVYSQQLYTGDGSSSRSLAVPFNADSVFTPMRTTPLSIFHGVWDRLRGNSKYMTTHAKSSEASSDLFSFSSRSNSLEIGYTSSIIPNYSGATHVLNAFRRAPGFFDVVCYTGGGSTTWSYNHNLGVAPELIITKNRSTNANANYWAVKAYPFIGQKALALNNASEDPISTTYWPTTADTATQFRVKASSTAYDCNATGTTYVAYLFASCPGVSKVGSYTGTGTTQQINCGFTGGARFVLIKRTDSTGDWYVWDSARGIVAGNDPYLLLNSTAAEVTSTDYIDTYSAGFEISSTAPAAINASGGSFIFLAIA